MALFELPTHMAQLFSNEAVLESGSAAAFPQRLRALPTSEPEPKALQPSEVSLSARERAIVFLMGHGLSNKQIARQLSIAPETVKSHAKHIFWKLTVRSRAQAVCRAMTLGLIALQ